MDSSTGIPLGRYLLGEKLASGGMGEVFIAVQHGLDGFEKPLAIKLLLPHLIEEQQVVKMFLDEARLCARMNHPNIVQILDLGREEGRYFLAMELVHGVSLVRLVRVLAQQQRTLSAPLILHVARGLLDALHYAHTLAGPDGKPLGLIHRDVTPHNILVSVNGEVKLTDFGIAKVQAAVGQTRPGVVRGKMDYLSPEQLRFQRLDSRVDLFAAGLTLYFLATGRSAFSRHSTQETLKALQNEPLPFLDLLRPDLPRALVEAISRATEKDPNRRFPSARAFRDALPPPSAEERAEVLGALVTEVCPAVVVTLDRASRTLVAMNATSSTSVPPLPKPETQSLSLSVPMGEPHVGTITETLSLAGTVAAPVMAELGTSVVPELASSYTPALEAQRNSTLALEAPPPLSRRHQRRMWAAALGGLLVLAALGVGWWVSRSGSQTSQEKLESPQPPDTTRPGSQVPSSGTEGSGPGQEESPPILGGKEEAREETEEPSPPVVAAPDPVTPPPTPPKPPEPRRPPAVGFLTVDAVPWANITIEGKP
ncbi:serine/threonine-protein kinase, partial [Hyalangium sp.]|uniref:serine/threonine-protein kinase n=1 Tax=Hyalangium sp. TaxID=2028555 RepID=UPI002D47C867